MKRFRHLSIVALSLNAMADITDSATERRMSLPAIPPGISIPKEDWTLSREQRRPGDTAVYYMLASEKRQMFFSVYIDKTTICQSAEACLDASLKNPQYKDAKELQRSGETPFKTAQFFLDRPNGAPLMQAHILVLRPPLCKAYANQMSREQ